VTKGEIFDVIINVSAGENRGKVHTFKLSEDIKKFLYVPSNYAHGFQALTDNATVNYLTDNEYKSEFDKGFHMASFNSIWPHEPSVLSLRDWNFPTFEEFCENI
jgi:dTDP-4-dehydrorhamnose 3,5-epimerase